MKRRRKLGIAGLTLMVLLLCCACIGGEASVTGTESEPGTSMPERTYCYATEEEVGAGYFDYSEGDIIMANAVVIASLESASQEDYVISLSVKDVYASVKETVRLREMYFCGESELFTDWTRKDMLENLLVVTAHYEVQYDGTKTSMNSGNIFEQYCLIREDGVWQIWQQESPVICPLGVGP